ncbi:MAG TPA: AsmA family protein [Gammaproteobacteria bacterium]|nr:AsmA family protein [Gammaproteobacteria bacterium]
MTKFLKRIFQILIALIAILAIAIIGIVNFVNPNQFKNTIEKEVLAKTGFVLTIQGPIQWRWFPMLSLEFNDIAIQNLAPFSGQMLSAKAIQAECELLPVFLGKIALAVNVKGLDLALSRNAKGQANWVNLNQHLNEQETNITKTIELHSGTKNTNPASSLSITLNSLKIQEGKITFSDRSKNSEYVLNHVNLSADNLFKGLSGAGAPLFLNFELTSNHQTLANIFFNTDWILKKEQEQLNLQKIALKFKLPDGTTNLITGDTEIRGFSQTPAIKANLLGNALQLGKIKIDKIEMAITAQEGIINFTPINIQIAKSQQNATLKLDVRGNTPKIYLTQEAHDFEINDLLTLFGSKDKLSGQTRLTMNLSATGADLQALQNSLSGKAEIEILNGKLHGIDVLNLLKNVQSNIQALSDAMSQNFKSNWMPSMNVELTKWKTDPNSNAFTPFNSIKTTAIINDGVINTPDLAINHGDYEINGSGTINPGSNSIHYQTHLQLKNNPYPATHKVGAFLYQTPLPIQIEGRLDDPKIRPELENYMKQFIRFQSKEKVEKAVNKAVEKALGNVKGNEAIHNTLQKALGDILNTQ